MKKKILKVLALVACAVLLVVGSIAGTYAFLTFKTDTVTNTFTYGNIQITLNEANVTEYGVVDGDTRVKANEYKLIPGHNYVKDPTITVLADSEACYLFVKVVNGISEIEADTTIAAQMAENGWKVLDSAAGIYYYSAVVETSDEDQTVDVFGEFTIKTGANVSGYGDATIEVTAYAVQADGVTGDNFAAKAATAWTNGGFN